ncbi:uncharacterized protein G2W53_015225 [Senna tora]|uniref:Uncharacterized protein n=1 Tax=Senna tora TaxID=362788 RepID=A0A835C9G5_9FABA|nr:uncharacterized protein G2W53_015225 [Senna tora]
MLLSLSLNLSNTLIGDKTLTIEGGSMATGHISRRRRLVASDLPAPSSRYSRSCRRKRRSDL